MADRLRLLEQQRRDEEARRLAGLDEEKLMEQETQTSG